MKCNIHAILFSGIFRDTAWYGENKIRTREEEMSVSSRTDHSAGMMIYGFPF